MQKKTNKIFIPISTLLVLMACFSLNNKIYADLLFENDIGDVTTIMINQAYERLGFNTAEEKSIADNLFQIKLEKVDGNDQYSFSFSLTSTGKEMVSAIGNDESSWITFVQSNNIKNTIQLKEKVNEVNSLRNQINSLMGSTTVNTSKSDVKVEVINGVYVLTSSTTGKNILSNADQSKLQQLIKEYEKMTGIPFNANTILDYLHFEEGENGNITLTYKPQYKHFKYIEKVVFTVKRIDGSGSVSSVLPLSQQLNKKYNSSIASKYKSITGLDFPQAQVSGNTITYDFSTPIFSKGGNVHDTIREKWSGTTNYSPALAVKVNNNGLFDVTAKVYGGTYIETSARYKGELKVTATPNHPYNNKTQEQVIGKAPSKLNVSAYNKWKKAKEEYDEKLKLYKKYKNYNLNTEHFTSQYAKFLNKSISNYKFNVKLPNPINTTTGSKTLYTQVIETEYWPYKERYTYTPKTYNQITYNFTETITGERAYTTNIKNNRMVTYQNSLINKIPDSKRSNQLLASYTWRVGSTNKEIIVPSTAQNAEIGSALTK